MVIYRGIKKNMLPQIINYTKTDLQISGTSLSMISIGHLAIKLESASYLPESEIYWFLTRTIALCTHIAHTHTLV